MLKSVEWSPSYPGAQPHRGAFLRFPESFSCGVHIWRGSNRAAGFVSRFCVFFGFRTENTLFETVKRDCMKTLWFRRKIAQIIGCPCAHFLARFGAKSVWDSERLENRCCLVQITKQCSTLTHGAHEEARCSRGPLRRTHATQDQSESGTLFLCHLSFASVRSVHPRRFTLSF